MKTRNLIMIAGLVLSATAQAQLPVVMTGAHSSVPAGTVTTLTWNAPGASSCIASGGWTGARPVTGQEAQPASTSAKSYVLTCSGPIPAANGSATVSWVAPTQNTDGSPLTDLASYMVVYGASAATMTSSKNVTAPATGTVITGLAAGTWVFAVKAVNTSGRESANSNTASKTIPVGIAPTGTATVAGPAPTIPGPPSGFTVIDPTAWTVEPKGSNFLTRLIASIRKDYKLGRQVGTIDLGSPCYERYKVSPDYLRVDRDRVVATGNLGNGWIVARCAAPAVS